MKKMNLKQAVVAVVAIAVAGCCGNKTSKCGAEECAQNGCEKSYAVYNPCDTLILSDMSLFFESDKAEVTQVNPATTRKMTYLNDLMMTIVELKGPMAEPDPFHSHKAEQICYIAEGRALVIIGDQQKQLKAGDIFTVPSDVPHTVQALDEKLVLVDAFNPIRQDFLKK